MISDRSRATDVIAYYRTAHPGTSISDLWSAVGTDVIFRIPAVRLAERQSALGNDVFMYRFDYATPVFGGVLGACHGLEIPFVFESLDKGAEMFLYELGVTESHRRRGIGRALVDALAALARERGCYGMWVATDEDNIAALATYRRSGAIRDDGDAVILTWRFADR